MKTPGEPVRMKCDSCGGDSVEVVAEKAMHETETGSQVEYMNIYSRCRTCGDEFYTVDQSMEHSRAIVSAIREAIGLLSPRRIVNARKRLGMTQTDFEHALGIGKKTVVRWERGTIAPSRAANGLLWLAERYPNVFLEYARERAAFDPVLGECQALYRTTVLVGSSTLMGGSAPSFFDVRSAWQAPDNMVFGAIIVDSGVGEMAA